MTTHPGVHVAPQAAADRVKQLARDGGFDLVRIAPATDLHVARERYLQWIADGRQGEMGWITADRAKHSSSPTSIQPGARAVVSVGLAYWNGPRAPQPAGTGRLARYAWGRDYHVVMGERLERLAAELRAGFGGESRWYVDTGPAMDKAFAAEAGVGWYGKNTNILTERFGSWVLLGEIVTTVELALDSPIADGCGTCNLCVRACPTGALGPDYSIDSRRCISYLTIEHRGPIPRDLRASMGTWVFGCDICQDVCPPSMKPNLTTPPDRRVWAAEVRGYLGRTADPDLGKGYTHTVSDDQHLLTPLPGSQFVDLVNLLSLSHQDYLERFRGTSIRRAKVWMLRRNAAVAIGNSGGLEAIEPLHHALNEDEHPVVRGHAAWALAQVGKRAGEERKVVRILSAANAREEDSEVREEIAASLAEMGAPVACTWDETS